MPLTYITMTAFQRTASEDRVRVIEHAKGTLVVLLADGAGGIPGGAAAADPAVAMIETDMTNDKIEVWSPNALCALLTELDHIMAADPNAGRPSG